MPYTAAWNNASAQGRLQGGTPLITLADAQELADAINRRRRLIFQSSQVFSSHLSGNLMVRRPTLAGPVPDFTPLRDNLAMSILQVVGGGMGDNPPTPTSMEWLWPETDG